MAEKKTQLSIILRTVDAATAKIKAVNDKLDAITKPVRDFKEALSGLREKSGLDDVIGGFAGVGNAITGILSKVAMVGGVVGVAVAGVFKLVDEFDELGDKAEAMGVSVEFLAQMRYAGERAGVAVQNLDGGMASFAKNLGLARAKSGPLFSFLGKTSPVLRRQVLAAKTNEEAIDLLATAFHKLEDPAKAAAAAQKLFGDASLAPLLRKGKDGIKELRDEYAKANPDVADAAKKAGGVDDAMKKLKASTDGVKAAIVSGLAPALEVIVKQLSEWFTEHREDVKAWAASLGERIPGAIDTLKGALKSVVGFITPFVDSATKLKVIAGVLAAIIVGPLVSAIYGLGVALLTTPVGWIVAGMAAIGLAAAALINDWGGVRSFFVDLWDAVSEKFGWAAHVIKLVLWPITGLATLFIGAWDEVSGFFVGLWDGITAVFSTAADVILGIVGKIIEGIDYVTNKVKEFVNGTEEGRADLLDRLGGGGLSVEDRERFIGGGSSSTKALVKVDFANVPRDTRVSIDPKSTADVRSKVGYNFFTGEPGR